MGTVSRPRALARRVAAALLFAGTLVLPLPGGGSFAAADGKNVPEDLRVPVAESVSRAVAFLARQQRPDGSFAWGAPDRPAWEASDGPAWDAGLTCLATLAMARGGAGLDHPAVRRALAWLRQVADAPAPPPSVRDLRTSTYGAACLLWLLSELRPPGFQRAAARCAYALARGPTESGLWTYGLPWVEIDARQTLVTVRPAPPSRAGDVSNTQFAVLGLLAAERLGILSDPTPWARLRVALRRLASRDGGFPYSADDSQAEALRRSYRVGTLVGATSYFLALRRGGISPEDALADDVVRRALEWIGRHPSFEGGSSRWIPEEGEGAERPPHYELLTLERLGVFLGLEQVGGMSWYRQGARLLLATQEPTGGWRSVTAAHGVHGAVENTTLAVLFLTRALEVFSVTTPSLTPTDLGAASEVPNPLFRELVFRGLRAWAAAEDLPKESWRRGFTGAGVRVLVELAVLVREGPAQSVEDAEDLLVALTGRPRTKGTRLERGGQWLDWLDMHRDRLAPDATGLRFVDAR